VQLSQKIRPQPAAAALRIAIAIATAKSKVSYNNSILFTLDYLLITYVLQVLPALPKKMQAYHRPPHHPP